MMEIYNLNLIDYILLGCAAVSVVGLGMVIYSKIKLGKETSQERGNEGKLVDELNQEGR